MKYKYFVEHPQSVNILSNVLFMIDSFMIMNYLFRFDISKQLFRFGEKGRRNKKKKDTTSDNKKNKRDDVKD